MKKLIYLIIVNFSIIAGGGNHVDTARIVDLRSKGGTYIDTLKHLGVGGDVDDARVLKVGDYLQINNKDEYVIKTVSRHLIVDDFKMIDMYKILKSNIEEKKDELEVYLGETTSEEVIQELEVNIIPFSTEDF